LLFFYVRGQNEYEKELRLEDREACGHGQGGPSEFE
jgi:hypothetical protein